MRERERERERKRIWQMKLFHCVKTKADTDHPNLCPPAKMEMLANRGDHRSPKTRCVKSSILHVSLSQLCVSKQTLKCCVTFRLAQWSINAFEPFLARAKARKKKREQTVLHTTMHLCEIRGVHDCYL